VRFSQPLELFLHLNYVLDFTNEPRVDFRKVIDLIDAEPSLQSVPDVENPVCIWRSKLLNLIASQNSYIATFKGYSSPIENDFYKQPWETPSWFSCEQRDITAMWDTAMIIEDVLPYAPEHSIDQWKTHLQLYRDIDGMWAQEGVGVKNSIYY
jgi:hypothetical protein